MFVLCMLYCGLVPIAVSASLSRIACVPLAIVILFAQLISHDMHLLLAEQQVASMSC